MTPLLSDSKQIPKARVVSMEGGVTPSLRSRVGDARSRVGDALVPAQTMLRTAVAVVYGFFPLVAAVFLLIALAWGAAMGQSP